MTGAQALVQVLLGYGIDPVFCSPGSEWPPLWEELARRRAVGEPAPRYLNVRHEVLAVAMASGYAKATGRLPAVLLHTTVGVLSGALALRAAYHEEIPMLVCVGESVAFGEDGGFDPGAQWLRYLADRGGPARLAESYVKWSFGVNAAAILASTVHRACQIAMTPPRGPVLVSLPFEYLVGPVKAAAVTHWGFPPPPLADPDALAGAAATLSAARNPVIVTETAGRDPAAVDALVALAESLGAPVVEGLAQTYLNFPRDHPLHGGFDGRPYLEDADVVLLAGAVGPWHPASAGPAASATVIALGDNVHRADSPYWGYRVDLAVPGELGQALAALATRVREQVPPAAACERTARWAGRSGARREAWRADALAHAEQKPLDARWVCHALNAVLPADAIVVEETITHRQAIVRHLDRLGRGAFFGGQSGGLGVGLGLALGIKCAAPARPVVLLAGDGSLNYNPVLAALGFSQEYGLPILTVVFNNRGYLSMKRGVPALYPEGWAVRTDTFLGSAIAPSPAYAMLAPVFGGHGEAVDDPRELRPALARALEAVRAGRSAIVDVVLAGDMR
ncbi:MAG: thiamine pyrophosphate-binding protein [Candidatus Rokubacteria bacterium]|nr:thiamine pyrophosphate-binding protein [Candidatus Rokubacteria bacterium]